MRLSRTIPLLGLAAWACTPDDDGFGQGGTGADAPDCSPSCDAPDTGDTGRPDTEDTPDTGDTGDTGDTDTGDTAQEPVPTGYDEGDVIYDLAGTTHEGADWALWDGRGATQVLVVGHGWDSKLAFIADYLPDLEATYAGLETTVVLEQAADTSEADQDDASDYASAYALSRVVWGADSSAFAGTTPKTYVIDRQLTIVMAATGSLERSEVADAIEAAP